MKKAHLRTTFNLLKNNKVMGATLSKLGVMLAHNHDQKLKVENVEPSHEYLIHIEPLTAKFFCCHAKGKPSPLFFRVYRDDKKN